MKSHMVHQFSQIPQANIPRSHFSRPSSYKTTFDGGYLVPFFLDNALPSDTFSLTSKFLIRFSSPLIAPIMDNLYCDVFFFAVPYRLLWDNWERFCGERVSPDDVYNGSVPTVQFNPQADNTHSLLDYFGIPVANLTKHSSAASVKVNALPFRAYNLIYQTWFKDENLQEAPYLYTGDANQVIANYPLRRRGKRHDYFTSCLPWPQKGPESIIAIGGNAPVYGNGKALGLQFMDQSSVTHFGLATINASSGATSSVSFAGLHTATFGDNPIGNVPTGTSRTFKGNSSIGVTPNKDNSGLIADLSAVNPIPINDFRRAVALQHWYEALARGGSRYREICRAVFGAVSPDARLQIPEYLGGGSFPIDFKTVEQTSATGASSDTPQGNLAAFGLGADTIGFTKSFTEHCVILGLLSVRADLTYQQGLDRMWTQSTLEDFYWPQFSGLGEQTVLSREIYMDGSAADRDVFGYQERYAEYRYKPSRITGKLNSEYTNPLDAWHLAQSFASRPVLNDSFIQDNPPLDRVVAVPAEPHFILDSFHDLDCARPMPLYGVPGLNRF